MARERLGVSRAAVSARSQIPVPTIRSYETGVRHPTRDHLIALLDALQVEPVQRSEILVGASYAAERAPLDASTPGYSFTVEEARHHIEEQPWPVAVLNENLEVIAANSVAQKLWDIDLDREFPNPIDRNMLVVASSPRFADRLRNWDEAISAGVALLKGHHRAPETMPEGTQTYFAAVLKRFFEGDPQYIAHFLTLWENVAPRSPKVRWSYPVAWDAPGFGEIRFRVTVNTCNESLGLAFNDWLPEDEASWRTWADVSASLG
jgi:transcriptional regulator with XRE-family HTH domain